MCIVRVTIVFVYLMTETDEMNELLGSVTCTRTQSVMLSLQTVSCLKTVFRQFLGVLVLRVVVLLTALHAVHRCGLLLQMSHMTWSLRL